MPTVGGGISAIQHPQVAKAAVPAMALGAGVALYAANGTTTGASVASTLTQPALPGLMANVMPSLAVGIAAQVLPGEQHAFSIGLGVLLGLAGGALLGK